MQRPSSRSTNPSKSPTRLPSSSGEGRGGCPSRFLGSSPLSSRLSPSGLCEEQDAGRKRDSPSDRAQTDAGHRSFLQLNSSVVPLSSISGQKNHRTAIPS